MDNGLTHDEKFMARAIELAYKGGQNTQSNPNVGAVLAYKNKIIGESYHKKYGEAHAEVNCINSVSEQDRHLISLSTLYVTLEPCCHYGKTPPCTDLILKHQIKKVVISVPDPYKEVNGGGIEKLRNHEVEVVTGVLKREGKLLLRKFNKNIQGLPYITLKMAVSQDQFIGNPDSQIWLSNSFSSVFTHRLRTNYDAILIGTNTAVLDNPKLTSRHYPGANPLRLVIDREGKIPLTHHIFTDGLPSSIFVQKIRNVAPQVEQIMIDDWESLIPKLLSYCTQNNLISVLLEGGATLVKSFLDRNLIDDAYVIKTNKVLGEGIRIPHFQGKLISTMNLDGNHVEHFQIKFPKSN